MSTQLQFFKTLINSENLDSQKIISFIEANSMQSIFKTYGFDINIFLDPENHSNSNFIRAINEIINYEMKIEHDRIISDLFQKVNDDFYSSYEERISPHELVSNSNIIATNEESKISYYAFYPVQFEGDIELEFYDKRMVKDIFNVSIIEPKIELIIGTNKKNIGYNFSIKKTEDNRFFSEVPDLRLCKKITSLLGLEFLSLTSTNINSIFEVSDGALIVKTYNSLKQITNLYNEYYENSDDGDDGDDLLISDFLGKCYEENNLLLVPESFKMMAFNTIDVYETKTYSFKPTSNESDIFQKLRILFTNTNFLLRQNKDNSINIKIDAFEHDKDDKNKKFYINNIKFLDIKNADENTFKKFCIHLNNEGIECGYKPWRSGNRSGISMVFNEMENNQMNPGVENYIFEFQRKLQKALTNLARNEIITLNQNGDDTRDIHKKYKFNSCDVYFNMFSMTAYQNEKNSRLNLISYINIVNNIKKILLPIFLVNKTFKINEKENGNILDLFPGSFLEKEENVIIPTNFHFIRPNSPNTTLSEFVFDKINAYKYISMNNTGIKNIVAIVVSCKDTPILSNNSDQPIIPFKEIDRNKYVFLMKRFKHNLVFSNKVEIIDRNNSENNIQNEKNIFVKVDLFSRSIISKGTLLRFAMEQSSSENILNFVEMFLNLGVLDDRFILFDEMMVILSNEFNNIFGKFAKLVLQSSLDEALITLIDSDYWIYNMFSMMEKSCSLPISSHDNPVFTEKLFDSIKKRKDHHNDEIFSSISLYSENKNVNLSILVNTIFDDLISKGENINVQNVQNSEIYQNYILSFDINVGVIGCLIDITMIREMKEYEFFQDFINCELIILNKSDSIISYVENFIVDNLRISTDEFSINTVMDVIYISSSSINIDMLRNSTFEIENSGRTISFVDNLNTNIKRQKENKTFEAVFLTYVPFESSNDFIEAKIIEIVKNNFRYFKHGDIISVKTDLISINNIDKNHKELEVRFSLPFVFKNEILLISSVINESFTLLNTFCTIGMKKSDPFSENFINDDIYFKQYAERSILAGFSNIETYNPLSYPTKMKFWTLYTQSLNHISDFENTFLIPTNGLHLYTAHLTGECSMSHNKNMASRLFSWIDVVDLFPIIELFECLESEHSKNDRFLIDDGTTVKSKDLGISKIEPFLLKTVKPLINPINENEYAGIERLKIKEINRLNSLTYELKKNEYMKSNNSSDIYNKSDEIVMYSSEYLPLFQRFSPDKNILAISENSYIKINVNVNGKFKHISSLYHSEVFDILFSSSFCITISKDEVKLWIFMINKELHLELEHGFHSFSPDEKFLIQSSKNGTKLFDMNHLSVISLFENIILKNGTWHVENSKSIFYGICEDESTIKINPMKMKLSKIENTTVLPSEVSRNIFKVSKLENRILSILNTFDSSDGMWVFDMFILLNSNNTVIYKNNKMYVSTFVFNTKKVFFENVDVYLNGTSVSSIKINNVDLLVDGVESDEVLPKYEDVLITKMENDVVTLTYNGERTVIHRFSNLGKIEYNVNSIISVFLDDGILYAVSIKNKKCFITEIKTSDKLFGSYSSSEISSLFNIGTVEECKEFDNFAIVNNSVEEYFFETTDTILPIDEFPISSKLNLDRYKHSKNMKISSLHTENKKTCVYGNLRFIVDDKRITVVPNIVNFENEIDTDRIPDSLYQYFKSNDRDVFISEYENIKQIRNDLYFNYPELHSETLKTTEVFRLIVGDRGYINRNVNLNTYINQQVSMTYEEGKMMSGDFRINVMTKRLNNTVMNSIFSGANIETVVYELYEKENSENRKFVDEIISDLKLLFPEIKILSRKLYEILSIIKSIFLEVCNDKNVDSFQAMKERINESDDEDVKYIFNLHEAFLDNNGLFSDKCLASSFSMFSRFKSNIVANIERKFNMMEQLLTDNSTEYDKHKSKTIDELRDEIYNLAVYRYALSDEFLTAGFICKSNLLSLSLLSADNGETDNTKVFSINGADRNLNEIYNPHERDDEFFLDAVSSFELQEVKKNKNKTSSTTSKKGESDTSNFSAVEKVESHISYFVEISDLNTLIEPNFDENKTQTVCELIDYFLSNQEGLGFVVEYKNLKNAILNIKDEIVHEDETIPEDKTVPEDDFVSITKKSKNVKTSKIENNYSDLEFDMKYNKFKDPELNHYLVDIIEEIENATQYYPSNTNLVDEKLDDYSVIIEDMKNIIKREVLETRNVNMERYKVIMSSRIFKVLLFEIEDFYSFGSIRKFIHDRLVLITSSVFCKTLISNKSKINNLIEQEFLHDILCIIDDIKKNEILSFSENPSKDAGLIEVTKLKMILRDVMSIVIKNSLKSMEKLEIELLLKSDYKKYKHLIDHLSTFEMKYENFKHDDFINYFENVIEEIEDISNISSVNGKLDDYSASIIEMKNIITDELLKTQNINMERYKVIIFSKNFNVLLYEIKDLYSFDSIKKYIHDRLSLITSKSFYDTFISNKTKLNNLIEHEFLKGILCIIDDIKKNKILSFSENPSEDAGLIEVTKLKMILRDIMSIAIKDSLNSMENLNIDLLFESYYNKYKHLTRNLSIEGETILSYESNAIKAATKFIDDKIKEIGDDRKEFNKLIEIRSLISNISSFRVLNDEQINHINYVKNNVPLYNIYMNTKYMISKTMKNRKKVKIPQLLINSKIDASKMRDLKQSYILSLNEIIGLDNGFESIFFRWYVSNKDKKILKYELPKEYYEYNVHYITESFNLILDKIKSRKYINTYVKTKAYNKIADILEPMLDLHKNGCSNPSKTKVNEITIDFPEPIEIVEKRNNNELDNLIVRYIDTSTNPLIKQVKEFEINMHDLIVNGCLETKKYKVSVTSILMEFGTILYFEEKFHIPLTVNVYKKESNLNIKYSGCDDFGFSNLHKVSEPVDVKSKNGSNILVTLDNSGDEYIVKIFNAYDYYVIHGIICFYRKHDNKRTMVKVDDVSGIRCYIENNILYITRKDGSESNYDLKTIFIKNSSIVNDITQDEYKTAKHSNVKVFNFMDYTVLLSSYLTTLNEEINKHSKVETKVNNGIKGRKGQQKNITVVQKKTNVFEHRGSNVRILKDGNLVSELIIPNLKIYDLSLTPSFNSSSKSALLEVIGTTLSYINKDINFKHVKMGYFNVDLDSKSSIIYESFDKDYKLSIPKLPSVKKLKLCSNNGTFGLISYIVEKKISSFVIITDMNKNIIKSIEDEVIDISSTKTGNNIIVQYNSRFDILNKNGKTVDSFNGNGLWY
jgi:hypothetical protein